MSLLIEEVDRVAHTLPLDMLPMFYFQDRQHVLLVFFLPLWFLFLLLWAFFSFLPTSSWWRVPRVSLWLFSLYINWNLIQSCALNTIGKLMTEIYISSPSPEIQMGICIKLSTRHLYLDVCWVSQIQHI